MVGAVICLGGPLHGQKRDEGGRPAFSVPVASMRVFRQDPAYVVPPVFCHVRYNFLVVSGAPCYVAEGISDETATKLLFELIHS